MLALLLAALLWVSAAAEEPDPWRKAGPDTWVGTFELPDGLTHCVLVRPSAGMAKGSAALSCR